MGLFSKKKVEESVTVEQVEGLADKVMEAMTETTVMPTQEELEVQREREKKIREVNQKLQLAIMVYPAVIQGLLAAGNINHDRVDEVALKMTEQAVNTFKTLEKKLYVAAQL